MVRRASTAAERARGGASPPGGPRFALRFEDGAGRLVLAQPFRFAFGEIDELELDLGRLRFPLDLSAGPGRFRTRRTRVRSARVRIDLPALLERFVEEPFELAPLAPIEGGMAFVLRDAFGTIALDVHARFEGPRLRLVPARARAAHEGPAAPLVRAFVAAQGLGFELEEDRGALLLRRPLSTLLMEALTPHGWRVPDDRSVRLRVEVLGSRRVALRTLAEGEEDHADSGAPWERARVLAPVVSLLAIGETDAARRAWEVIRERHEDVSAAELGFGELEGDGLVARCARLRAALRAERAVDAARCAEDLAPLEPCDAVAVEGLCAAADLAMTAQPALAATLLERACARRPSEVRIALRLIAAATRLADRGRLARVIESTLGTREPGPARGEFASEAAMLCELAGHADAAADLWRCAAEHRPNDPRVLEGLALAKERAHDVVAARELYDRAASEHSAVAERDAEARALRGAAAAARSAGDDAAAEGRLTRAAEIVDDAATWAALAAVRRALGRVESTLRAEDALLRAAPREAHIGDDVALAIGHGVRDALGSGRLERAKVWLAALERSRPDHPSLPGLAAAVEERDLAARTSDPARLFELAPARLAAVLARTDDPGALLRDALSRSSDLDAALASLGSVRDGDLGDVIADAVAARAEDVTEGETLLALVGRATTDAAKARLAEAAHARLEEGGDPAAVALALARVGAVRRDTAMLRAALSAAERVGARGVARQIVDLALEVVGSGPARGALEAVRRRLDE